MRGRVARVCRQDANLLRDRYGVPEPLRKIERRSSGTTIRRAVVGGFATTVIGFGVGILVASPSFAQGNPERNVYFGQTHVHTSWSFDAYVFGNTVTGPEDAYKYALGQPIKHPGGYMVQLKRPLDFEAVTDHAEYVGMVRLANDPGSAFSKLPIAEKLKVRSKDDIQKIYLFLGESLLKNEPIKDLIDPACR